MGDTTYMNSKFNYTELTSSTFELHPLKVGVEEMWNHFFHDWRKEWAISILPAFGSSEVLDSNSIHGVPPSVKSKLLARILV